MAAKRAKAKTPSERTAERRADLVAKGWAQKNWLLPPAALASLAAIVKREGCTETEAVERALTSHAERPQAAMSKERLLAEIARRLK